MIRRTVFLAVFAAALTGPALAEAPAVAADGSFVDITPVAAPILHQGRLVNYVFVNVRLWARPGTDVTTLRTREPEFRDALVRAAHRTPFVLASDLTRVDEAALTRSVMADASRIAGRGVFQRAQITSQTPQRRSGLPRSR